MKHGQLVYITVPEQLTERFSGFKDAAFDFSIPLPVESETEHFAPETLEPEMIFSGILLHLAENPGEQHAAYYRNLVTTLKPTLASELREAAVIKAKNGDYETALEILDVLFGLAGQTPALLLDRALVLEGKASSAEHNPADAAFEEAEAAYEKALASPLSGTFFYTALFCEKRGNYAKAASCLKAFLDLSGEDETTEESAADEDGGEAQRHKARELLAEIRNNGLDDECFAGALSLIRQGNEEAGILKARDFLERHPGVGRGWFVLGWGLRRLGRWQDGAACFEKAHALGCVNADTRNELAICRMESGDFAAAQAELEKALRLDPDNIKIISNLGVLAVKQNDNDKAAAFFRTVLELDPDDPIAKTFFGGG